MLDSKNIYSKTLLKLYKYLIIEVIIFIYVLLTLVIIEYSIVGGYVLLLLTVLNSISFYFTLVYIKYYTYMYKKYQKTLNIFKNYNKNKNEIF